MRELTLIRHATLLLSGLGRDILVDPMLRDAGATPRSDELLSRASLALPGDQRRRALPAHQPSVHAVNVVHF
jgi:L-ascorbate metabolism protein UlaG (beta-lactamase superfamily)